MASAENTPRINLSLPHHKKSRLSPGFSLQKKFVYSLTISVTSTS